MDEINKFIYTPLPKPIPITKQVWPEGTLPLVFTRTMTYMHEKYIRSCIKGILMQRTTFPVQVLIHDDASTDKTAKIVKEYEQKYPHVIKAYYQKENTHTHPDKSKLRREFFRWQVGKYFAICEGDDYWTDPYKLQKQVDFLEANEDSSICFHPVKVYNENEKGFTNSNVVDVPEVTDIKTLALSNYINTPSVMYRRDKRVGQDKKKFPKLPVGDYRQHILYAQYGKIKKLPDTMAVYRIHKGGIWSTKKAGYTHLIWLELLEALLDHFTNEQEICKNLKEQYIKTAASLLDSYIADNDIDSQKSLYDRVEKYIGGQFHEASFLVFNNLVKKLNNEIITLKNSRTYRLGKIVAKPLQKLRSIWRKLAK